LDKDKALEEMRRVLKPDGKIIILEIDPNTPRGKRLKLRLYFILEPNYINHHS
jgi:ubiquinone/menaquinone biosynthesis C-methylase UbiE